MWLIGAVLGAAGWLVLRDWRLRPFSEDDGNWFFLAMFQEQGARLWQRGFHTVGYFGIEWLSALATRAFPRRDPAFFYAAKAVWMIATCLALLWAGGQIFGPGAGALAGAALLIVVAMPATLFALTYGEHVSLLPLAIGLGCGVAGFQTGSPLLCAVAGGMGAWMVHIKITGLVCAALLPLPLLFAPSGSAGFGWFVLGAGLVMAAPVAIIPLVHRTSPRQYVLNLTLPLVEYALYLLERLHLPGARRLWNQAIGSWEYEVAEEGDSYIGMAADQSRGRRLPLLWTNVRWSLRDCAGIVLLAVLWLATWPLRLDWGTALTVYLFGALLLTFLIQQNYFTPHLNPLWLPVALWAGAAGAAGLAMGGVWAAGVVAVLVAQAVWLGIRMRPFASRDTLGLNPDGSLSLWGFYGLAEDIGTQIGDVARPGERLLVWGDHPAMYLYARRYYFGRPLFFLYGHGGRLRYEQWLFGLLRDDPPELLLFFNRKVQDEWDVQAVSRRACATYLPERLFQVAASEPGAPAHEFALYRLDVRQRRMLLLEEGRRAVAAKDMALARERFDRVLAMDPDCAEAALRREMLDMPRAQRHQWREERAASAQGADEAAALGVLRAEAALERGDARTAAKLLDEALAHCGEDVGALILRGEAAFAMGERGAAMTSFRRALAVNPFSADALVDMAVAFSMERAVDEARGLLDMALACAPEHDGARQSLAALGPAAETAENPA
jgi:tetratricopeptide (TPR) repeat protein